MIPKEKQIEVRKALIAGGLRTVAYNFDGAGDSGNLEGLLLPDTFPTPTLEAFAESTLDESFIAARHWGKLPNGEYGYLENKAAKPALELIASITQAEDVLEQMAYAALEHFDGDWVNNDGGYGIVTFDLLTGDFRIDGFQRYTDSHDADSSGTFIEALDPAEVTIGELDLAAVLKSTLNA